MAVAEGQAAPAAASLDPSAGTPQLIGELRALAAGTARPEAEALVSVAGHADALVRLAVARLLVQRPELEPSGALASLAADPDERVALAALLGLARSHDPEALGALDANLAAPSPSRRETVAVGLAVRAAIAADEGLPPVTPELLARSRAQIVTEQGQHWLEAIAQHDALQAAESDWEAAQGSLHALERAPETAACVARVRTSPALLLPIGTDPSSARLTEPVAWPRVAALRPAAESASALLATGQHDALAERRYAAEDEVRSLRRFVRRLEDHCGNATSVATPQVAVTPVSGPEPPQGLDESEGWAGVGLGIANNPFAYRPGGTQFLIGDDIELTLVPELRYRLLRGRAREPAMPGEGRWPPVVDGWGLELRAGAVLSTAFFEDRSRPEASAVVLVDRSVGAAGRDDGRARHRRIAVFAALSPGAGDVSRDLTYYPAPHARGGLAFTRTTSEDAQPGPRYDAAFAAELAYVNYLFDDANAPPRDRRWLGAELGGHWLGGALTRRLRLGLRGGAEVRSGPRVDEVMATSGQVAPMLRWTEGDLRLDLWAGAGGGWLVAPPGDAFDDTPFADVVGGFDAELRTELADLQMTFGVGLDRSVGLLGRNGYVGTRERAEADVHLSLAGAMRDAIGLTVFAERARPGDGGLPIGFGGLEIFIPVGLVEIDQEITYRMRYLALFDESRFGTRSQEVFEAVLSAGARF